MVHHYHIFILDCISIFRQYYNDLQSRLHFRRYHNGLLSRLHFRHYHNDILSRQHFRETIYFVSRLHCSHISIILFLNCISDNVYRVEKMCIALGPQCIALPQKVLQVDLQLKKMYHVGKKSVSRWVLSVSRCLIRQTKLTCN